MSGLLAMIYVAFISLGIPDGLLGAAWPSMREGLGVPVSFAGVISMIISIGTILSSLNGDALTRRFGTGNVTAMSVAVTAGALWGFSVSRSFWMLCLMALPYGLGAGAVDAALNNYVALHYKARHMSWLHCFWGVGASLGPYIMGSCLSGGLSWSGGYWMVSILQVALTTALFGTLPLWKNPVGKEEERESGSGLRIGELLKLPGAKAALASFFCYCALEQTAGLWASSYLSFTRGMPAEAAATWASLFYLGITAGRFVCGFITMKLDDKAMVRLGQSIAAAGIGFLALPLGQQLTGIGLVMVGMGCAPIFPALLHETPANFGKERSQAVMGMQMASAYVGNMAMPPLFGLIFDVAGVGLYPCYLFVLVSVMIIMVERLNRLPKKEE